MNLTETTEPDAVDIPDFRTEPRQPGLPLRLAVYSRHVSMSDLAVWLYPRLQLPVLDKTGITGLFDIEITGLRSTAMRPGRSKPCGILSGSISNCTGEPRSH